MLKGKLLKQHHFRPKIQLDRADTPVHQHSPKFTANLSRVPGQQVRMLRSSHGTEPCAHSQGGWRHCNSVSRCWLTPGLSEHSLPKHPSPPPGSLPFRLRWEEWDLAGFPCSAEMCLHERRGEAPRLVYTAGYLMALISPSHRTLIADKGKICLEKDLAATCLTLVLWCFRYNSTYSQPYRATALLPVNTRAHSVKRQVSVLQAKVTLKSYSPSLHFLIQKLRMTIRSLPCKKHALLRDKPSGWSINCSVKFSSVSTHHGSGTATAGPRQPVVLARLSRSIPAGSTSCIRHPSPQLCTENFALTAAAVDTISQS